MSSQRIIPNIWFNGNAQEAGEFYAVAIPETTSRVAVRYPEAGLPDFQSEYAGKPLVVEVDVLGYLFALINAGPEFTPNPSISFILNFDPREFGGDAAARARLDQLWAALSDGGSARLELGAYPFSPHYGWIEDRYGVNWQLMLTDPNGATQPFVTPQLLFTGPAQNRAKEAIELYTSLFADSGVGFVVERPEDEGLAPAGTVVFSGFQLAGQPFSAMDSPVEHAFEFTCGISFEVRCAGQAEIDRLWKVLSAVPEAEQCGWLADPFGVSWQIVPDNLDELMARPNAYANLMGMHKIVIADF